MDAEILSRIQFGFTIAFHIMFPALSIGFVWLLVFMEGAWHRTGNERWIQLYRFWAKIFALCFGLGVVSGLVMSYEIGTNFAGLSKVAGSVLGPLLSSEVLTAFFIEAGFLGVMLFGWKRVGPKLHFLATFLVAFGTTSSAFWILTANSWMQTPAGAKLIDGRFVPENWLHIIFNPSMPYRFSHMMLAAILTASLVLAGVSAWMVLRKKHDQDLAQLGLRLGVWALAILAPLQIFVGDQSGLEVLHHQPAKLAAIEANWKTQGDVPLLLLAWPDAAKQKNLFEIGIPHGASLIVKHSWDGVVPGLRSFPKKDQPPVWPTFYGFRIMVALGFWFLFLGWVGAWLLRGGRLHRQSLMLWAFMLSAPLGWVATVLGWIVAEVGRQPWVVYGMLRTAQAVSPVPAGAVAWSFATFVVIYTGLLLTFFYFLAKIIGHGFEEAPTKHPEAMRGARIGEIVEED